jgi:predicted small metal-binding protein
MKTMTCRQLGGPCEHAHQGESADDVINAQDQHLKDAVAAGDEAHQEAADAMKGRWKRPISGMKWYKQAKKDFAALPDE